MPIFAANLTLMFNEWPFLDRFAAAADAGFTAVEYLFPYDHPPEAIAQRLDQNNLTQALFNLPPGDWAAGERGLAALPERFEAVMAGLATALPYVEATGVKRVHLMAGIADALSPEANAAWRRSLRYVAGPLADRGVDLLIEPINGIDMPGYFLNDFAIAETAIAQRALEERAGLRGAQLRLPVPGAGPARLRGLRRLRIPAAGQDSGWAALADRGGGAILVAQRVILGCRINAAD
jgi:hydroxypyruvate isomerase